MVRNEFTKRRRKFHSHAHTKSPACIFPHALDTTGQLHECAHCKLNDCERCQHFLFPFHFPWQNHTWLETKIKFLKIKIQNFQKSFSFSKQFQNKNSYFSFSFQKQLRQVRFPQVQNP